MRLAFRSQHLADEDGVEFGGHIGLDDTPLDDVAIIEDRGEGEDEDVLYGGADERVAFLIQFVYEAHALAYHFEIVFEGHAFGIVRQDLDGLPGGRRGAFAGEVAADLW